MGRAFFRLVSWVYQYLETGCLIVASLFIDFLFPINFVYNFLGNENKLQYIINQLLKECL